MPNNMTNQQNGSAEHNKKSSPARKAAKMFVSQFRRLYFNFNPKIYTVHPNDDGIVIPEQRSEVELPPHTCYLFPQIKLKP